MLDAACFAAVGLADIFEKVMAGERLSPEDGLLLFSCPDLTAVGALAAHARFQRHGKRTCYVVNRQINYTNVCVNDCVFCAFRRDSEAEAGAFTLGADEIMARIEKAMSGNLKLDELHMVGGCHPRLGIDFFTGLISEIHARWPGLPIKAFTPVEIAHFAKMANITTAGALRRLKQAGLVMLAGGGAEIFAEKLRSRICPAKADATTWLKISGEAHGMGIKSNCTMLFGHLESWEDRVDHLCRLRAQQDKSGGFTCFIPLPFLKKNSRLVLPRERQAPADALDQLRTIAVARLMLDNIPHIKAYWIMLGAKLAQTALWYGADDLDGTIVEEHIGHMAGAASAQGHTIYELENMIRQSGFEPMRRNAVFDTLDAREEAFQCI